MNKNDIKSILMSMRNGQNESQINNLLGKIDLIEEHKLQSMITQIGNNEESIRRYLEQKLSEKHDNNHEEHTMINDMFSYGIAGDCIHLHMPIDLHEMMSKKGIRETFDTVNLYLLDAIEKIRNLQKDGFYRFEGKDSIYMISPILVGREMKFLREFDFETVQYKKEELQNDEFVEAHPEAQLAVHVFGRNNRVGTAKIGLDVINSPEWQARKGKKVEEYEKKGITLEREEDTK